MNPQNKGRIAASIATIAESIPAVAIVFVFIIFQRYARRDDLSERNNYIHSLGYNHV